MVWKARGKVHVSYQPKCVAAIMLKLASLEREMLLIDARKEEDKWELVQLLTVV